MQNTIRRRAQLKPVAKNPVSYQGMPSGILKNLKADPAQAAGVRRFSNKQFRSLLQSGISPP
jgi:hypothetical protein